MSDKIAADAALRDTGEVIPVLDEVATFGVRQVQSSVRATIKVTERDETVERLLTRQDVRVERVPRGHTVTEAPAIRQEGDVTIVPVLEEVLVVQKQLVLREELHIRIIETQDTARQTVTLRREHAEIDRGGQFPATATGETT